MRCSCNISSMVSRELAPKTISLDNQLPGSGRLVPSLGMISPSLWMISPQSLDDQPQSMDVISHLICVNLKNETCCLHFTNVSLLCCFDQNFYLLLITCLSHPQTMFQLPLIVVYFKPMRIERTFTNWCLFLYFKQI